MYLSSSPSSSEMKWDSDSYDDDETDSNSYDDESDCKRPKNDVFMNYSYEDIGKQFISHLRGALDRRGFTISDHIMLHVGQNMRLQLLKAIEESKIYVVVFSTNYASSVRSLDELVDIMECLGKFDQRKVLPVFYKAEPSDVRSQEGSFKEAFQAYEANSDIDPKRVQKWKQALRDAAEPSDVRSQEGSFKEAFQAYEANSDIDPKRVQKWKQALRDADHPVVVGSRVKELISILRLDCEDVLVVAVFGVSGIGKTTIVRATYNKISSYFDVSCFLGDIHYRGGGHDWKIELQNLLISCLTQNYKFPSMHRHNDGVTKIRNLIRGRKILLVLDEVDNFEQLKSLGINPAWFYQGSRIIVITRDKQSLGNIPYTSYQTMELNRRESLNLFNRLMFSKDNNLVNMNFIEEVVALAGGLPLVLEVWSRYFIGHERKQWPSLLKKLKRIPHDDVQKQLQMSYDSLSVTAKNLFLDIACFFDGMDKESVFKVLHDEESAFFPDIEIQQLVDKFLVKYIDQSRLVTVTMNQVIREMGQEVIRQENVDEPGKRTRLINHRDILRVFRDWSGSYTVFSPRIEEPVTLQLEAFKKMSNLRFIKLENPSSLINLQWSSSSNDDMSCFAFKHLKYLEWHGFPFKSLDNIDMGNVVVIKLWNSKLEKLWEGVKNFKMLKILDVSWSNSLTKTGNFIGLENLEELDLSRCRKLEKLDSSIGCLQKLVQLDLDGYGLFKRLPWEMISKLTSLQKLNLPGCFNVLGSEGFSQFTGLRHFDDECDTWASPEIYNKTKGTRHCFRSLRSSGTMMIMFYPLNDTTLVVEAGDTVEVVVYENCGLRLVYEDEVADSGLVLKDVMKPTHSQFPLLRNLDEDGSHTYSVRDRPPQLCIDRKAGWHSPRSFGTMGYIPSPWYLHSICYPLL
ncbi:TMV resistance protein N [Artemisia annua]|uniref:TMV resistance protein N n=1 Tax=Artemisia annua TaxID=35608 RepID=A0A2U1LPD4_ARTAN|nr:TMV resistance protein N [Artemisia annua]